MRANLLALSFVLLGMSALAQFQELPIGDPLKADTYSKQKVGAFSFLMEYSTNNGATWIPTLSPPRTPYSPSEGELVAVFKQRLQAFAEGSAKSISPNTNTLFYVYGNFFDKATNIISANGFYSFTCPVFKLTNVQGQLRMPSNVTNDVSIKPTKTLPLVPIPGIKSAMLIERRPGGSVTVLNTENNPTDLKINPQKTMTLYIGTNYAHRIYQGEVIIYRTNEVGKVIMYPFTAEGKPICPVRISRNGNTTSLSLMPEPGKTVRVEWSNSADQNSTWTSLPQSIGPNVTDWVTFTDTHSGPLRFYRRYSQ